MQQTNKTASSNHEFQATKRIDSKCPSFSIFHWSDRKYSPEMMRKVTLLTGPSRSRYKKKKNLTGTALGGKPKKASSESVPGENF